MSSRTAKHRTAPQQLVTQFELARARKLERQIEALTAEFEDLRCHLFEALDEGAEVEDGPLTARIETRAGRRSVPWKQVVVRLKGEGYASRVLAATKPGPGRRVLVIA